MISLVSYPTVNRYSLQKKNVSFGDKKADLKRINDIVDFCTINHEFKDSRIIRGIQELQEKWSKNYKTEAKSSLEWILLFYEKDPKFLPSLRDGIIDELVEALKKIK